MKEAFKYPVPLSGDLGRVAVDSSRPLRLARLLEILRCPATLQPLLLGTDNSSLTTVDGKRTYFIRSGVPVLLMADQLRDWGEDFATVNSEPKGVRRRDRWARSILTGGPSISSNLVAHDNLRHFADLLASVSPAPWRVLIVGGATLGEGLERLQSDRNFDVIGLDLALGPATDIVADAHALPFNGETFDGAICQAVLEHVTEPGVVVKEVHRVLRLGGIVYSEIPFMQQVHEGAHDVSRFTLTGHRILYKDFDEISTGTCCGPGMALAWSVRYFLMAPWNSPIARALISRGVTLTLFWLKYIDRLLIRRPGASDAASGTYFLGRRRESARDVRDIYRSYRGAIRNARLTRRD